MEPRDPMVPPDAPTEPPEALEPLDDALRDLLAKEARGHDYEPLRQAVRAHLEPQLGRVERSSTTQVVDEIRAPRMQFTRVVVWASGACAAAAIGLFLLASPSLKQSASSPAAQMAGASPTSESHVVTPPMPSASPLVVAPVVVASAPAQASASSLPSTSASPRAGDAGAPSRIPHAAASSPGTR